MIITLFLTVGALLIAMTCLAIYFLWRLTDGG